MATHPERVVLTYADYLELHDDRMRYQLLEGELDVTPAPSTIHQTVVKNLLVILDLYVRRGRLGTVFVAPCDVVLNDNNVVQPDLLFVSRERAAIIERACVRGAPDLIVEVLSPRTERTDREIKWQIYARYGVAHYWLIDPDRREATALVLEAGGYRQAVVAQGGETFAAPPFADLAIPLADVWAGDGAGEVVEA
ncbi:MAG: Uma2 family endonuclease [Chloroflexi bacterium]|nr:Uma2 family endonuclease [Chloroflexota bacterium]